MFDNFFTGIESKLAGEAMKFTLMIFYRKVRHKLEIIMKYFFQLSSTYATYNH